MPELPDVAVFKSYLDATALHQRIAQVHVRDRDLLDGVSSKKLRSRLTGTEFASTSTHGKYLFVGLNDDHGWLVLHFGMTGFLKYYQDKDDRPAHTRVLFDFDNGNHLAYDCQRKLGSVSFTEDRQQFIDDRDLGPDALGEDLDLDRFLDILDERTAGIKSTLMNQKRLAGIGNVYSDEILFQSGLHPAAKVRDLDDESKRTLLRTIRRVLKTAIDRRADIERFPKTWLLRNIGGQCSRCGTAIESIRLSGRRAHLCPQCQG